jgi:flagellar hook-basal body complex protein FliE
VIAPIGAVPITPPVAPTAATGATQATGSTFAEGLQSVSSLTSTADALSGQVATGQIGEIHAFTAAAAKAQIGVELTVALRNKAVESYQEIMRMQL